MDYFRQKRLRGKRKKEAKSWPKRDLYNYKKISKQLLTLGVQRLKSTASSDEQQESQIYLA